MDIGIPQSIVSSRGTLVFNSEVHVAATGGSYTLQLSKIDGMDGAGIRNPTTLKPHKSGALIHKFKRAPRIWTLEGLILASDPATRWYVSDLIRGVTDAMVEADGAYYFQPPINGYQQRHLTCRLYDVVDASQMNEGPAGPKTFDLIFIAGDWRAYSAGASTITMPTYSDLASTHFIPNAGNTDAWLSFDIHCNGHAITSWELRNADSGELLNWVDPGGGTNWLAVEPLSTRHAVVDMFEESISIGGGHDGLYGLSVTISDFFKIPPGGANIFFDSNDHPATCVVDPLDAWV